MANGGMVQWYGAVHVSSTEGTPARASPPSPLVQQQNTDVHKQNTDVQQQNTDVQQQNTDVQQQNTDVQQQNTDVQQQNTDVHNKQNTDVQQQNTDVHKQNTDVQQQNTDVQQQNTDRCTTTEHRCTTTEHRCTYNNRTPMYNNRTPMYNNITSMYNNITAVYINRTPMCIRSRTLMCAPWRRAGRSPPGTPARASPPSLQAPHAGSQAVAALLGECPKVTATGLSAGRPIVGAERTKYKHNNNVRVYARDGPIGCRTCGYIYILVMDQSDAERAGIFS
eukprot:1178059-Prorocentrum_minimum.AAC.1